MRLSMKLVLSIVATSVAGLVIAFLVVNTVVRNVVHDNIIESTQHNMTVHANELDGWFVNALYLTNSMAANMSGLSRAHMHYMAIRMVAEYPFLETAYAGFGYANDYDSDSHRGVTPGGGWVLSERPWYKQAFAAQGEAVFTSPYVSWLYPYNLVVSIVRWMPDWGFYPADNDFIHYRVGGYPGLTRDELIQLSDENGWVHYDAVIGVDLVLDELIELADNIDVPGNGYIFILDDQGYIINHPHADFAPHPEEGLRNVFEFDVYAELDNVLGVERGVSSFMNRQGESAYMMVFPMNAAAWTMVAVMPIEVTTEPVRRTLTIVMITFVSVMVGAFALVLFLVPRLIASVAGRINARVQGFRDYTTAVAKGEVFDFSPASAYDDPSFGLDKITTEFDNNMLAILALITDMTAMHQEQEKGNYKVLLEPSRYEGAYTEVARNLNGLIKLLADQLHTINESILYASKLQRSLLPEEDKFKQAFSDHGIIWKPRDIVGGDIYWLKNFEDGAVLAVADCTGHGTPGALLTMLVASILDSSVTKENYKDTAEIIYRLDRKLSAILNVDAGGQSPEINDGCDIAVLFIGKDKNIIMSSGKTSLFACDGNEVTRYKGQSISVGEGKIAGKGAIEKTIISADAETKFYIASDGLFDQLGSEKRKQFGFKAFTKTIHENHKKNLGTIVQAAWDAFENHRGNELQRDDVELIAFKP